VKRRNGEKGEKRGREGDGSSNISTCFGSGLVTAAGKGREKKKKKEERKGKARGGKDFQQPWRTARSRKRARR